MLDELVPAPSSGNTTSVEIAAQPDEVWDALNQLTFRECRATSALLALRSIPRLVTERGARARGRSDRGEPRTVVEAMSSGRFNRLNTDPPHQLVLGIVGQFWKPSGGTDAEIADADAFKDFDEPGYVKSAIEFRVEPTPNGARLSTETRNVTTDPASARRFGIYWKLIGWGSKATRIDMLRAVKRRAERVTNR